MSKSDIKEFDPIRDIDEEWELDEKGSNENFKLFQAKRWPGLFKIINKEGKVKYTDFERFDCIDINNLSHKYQSTVGRMTLDELHPIEFPYQPGNVFKIYIEQFELDGVHVECVTYIRNIKNVRPTMEKAMRAFTTIDRKIQEITMKDYLSLKIRNIQTMKKEINKNAEQQNS